VLKRSISDAGALRRAPAVSVKRVLRAGVFIAAFSLATGHTLQPVLAQQIPVNSVTIEGNQRIGDAAILTRAGIEPGQSISAGRLNAGLQALQASGLFESVEITPQGNGLVINVVEFPTINRINFEGNRRISDEILAETIGSNERRVFNPAQAEADAALIAEAYSAQGRIAARVTPTIIRREDNRVDLIFEIFEGDVIEIERVSFSGNRVFSDRRLRRVLETKQAGLFRSFVRADTLIEDRIDFDRQVLRDFYFSRGYVDFQVNSVNAEVTQERDAYFLVFDILEGQQFRIGDVTVVSDLPEVDADAYLAITKATPTKVYSPLSLETDIARMERQAVIDGVDFLRVEPRITRNERDLTIDVEYALVRGPRVFVERIDIEGNTTTLDRVIRRQFDSVEGDPFNPREIRQSAERIRALGFFSNAQVNAREGSSPDLVVVDVDVEEQPTGSLSFGASFSTNDGFGVALQFRERNFLGRGQELGFTLSTASEDRLYRFDFTEPAFLGRDVALGLRLDISETENSNVSYDTERGLFSPSLTFPVGLNSNLALNYTYEETEMKQRGSTNNGAVISREIDAGDLVNSSFGYRYSFDSRRTGVDPTAGYLLEFGQDFAGVGGDNTFVRTSARVAAERRVFNEDVVLRADVQGGALSFQSGTNRAVDRYILRSEILRGFEPGGIGPRDLSENDDDALGGNLFFAARFDAEFPLPIPEEYGISGGVFYDVGNLWDLGDVDTSGGDIVGENGSLRHVVGISILWDTPIGPLRFNFSDAIVKEDFDRDQSFEFTVQTTF